MAQDPPGSGWTETYKGGSREAEAARFEILAQQMVAAQEAVAQRDREQGGAGRPVRALHAKATLALDGAQLRFADDLAPDLRHGFAQPGSTCPVILRFSNASAVPGADRSADMRGVSLRILIGDEQSLDLLMTNFPVSYARDAEQFVALATATTGGGVSAIAGLLGVVRRFGVRETVRMVRNVTAGRKHQPGSVLTETYWSRGALSWGPAIAVRFLLAPDSSAADLPASTTDPEYLHREAVGRLRAGPVRMHLFVQRFRDEESTPIEDTSVEWLEAVAPREQVATLTIPSAELDSDAARQRAAQIEALAFTPWNRVDGFRPLGNLNRSRGTVYAASAQARGAAERA